MDNAVTGLITIVLLIVYMVIVGKIAGSLNRSVAGWCILCLFLPVVGCLFLAYVASKQIVRCPQCGRVFSVNGRAVTD